MRTSFGYHGLVANVFALSLLTVPSALEAEMECNHADIQAVASRLSIEEPVKDVVALLDATGSLYTIYSKHTEHSAAISMRTIADKGIEALSPITIVVRSSDQPTRSKYVTEGELLTLRFDARGQLKEKSCKRFFTGP